MRMYIYVLLIIVSMSIPSIYASSILDKDIAGMKQYLAFPIWVEPYDVYAYRYPWHLYLNGSGYIDVYVDSIYSVVNGSRIISGYVVKNNSVIGLEAGFYRSSLSLGRIFEIGFTKYVNGSYNNFSISMIFEKSGSDGVIDFRFEYRVNRFGNTIDIAPFVCPYSPCYPLFVGMYIMIVNNSIKVYYVATLPSSRTIFVYGNTTLVGVDASFVVNGSIQYIKLLDGFKGYVSHVVVGESSVDHVLDVFSFYENPSFYLIDLGKYEYYGYIYGVLGRLGEDYLELSSSSLIIVVDPMYSVYDRYSGKIVFFNPWYPTSYFPIAYVNASIASYVIIDDVVNRTCSSCYDHRLYVFRNNPFVRKYGENAIVFRYFPVCIVKFIGTGEEIVVLGDEYLWYIPYLPNDINIYFPVQYINLPYRYGDYVLTTFTTTVTQTMFIKTSTPVTSPSPTQTGFDWTILLLLALLAVFGVGIAYALKR